jgi:hypothetical protein
MDSKSTSEEVRAEGASTLEAELASLSAKERQLLEENHRLRNELAAAKMKLKAASTIIGRMKDLLAIWK